MLHKLLNIKIATKLPVILVLAAIITATGVGIGAYRTASQSTSTEVSNRLNAVLEGRVQALSLYFSTIEQDILTMASNPLTHEAIRALTTAWQDLSSNQTQTLQSAYITDNPFPVGQKEKLDTSKNGTQYDQAHAKYHPWLRGFLQEKQYYDIFLFDLQGNLIYTVFKEQDFATNLSSGKYRSTDLAKAYKAGRSAASAGSLSFFDFSAYAPSGGAPASFISTPVFDESNAKIGVLVFQMPISRMNAIMNNSVGLGQTGETFIVGKDGLMRSDSRFSTESTILKRRVDNPAITKAIAGSNAIGHSQPYNGFTAEISAAPFAFHDVNWALVSVVETDEVFAPIIQLRNTVLLIAGVILVLVIVVGLLFARSITNPLSRITNAMRELADGNVDIKTNATHRKDELGEMARAVAVFRDNAIQRIELEARNEENAEVERERQQKIESLIASFRQDIAQSLSSLTADSETMKVTVSDISSAADETFAQADEATQASSNATNSVQAVAAAAEELSASINEISRQIMETNQTVDQAAAATKRADTRVGQLSESATKIGEVVSLIEDIAEQTNLLALNATIEAARAGEAGRGFAVVASEVKELAGQTAKATESIIGQIQGIQSETSDAVEAISEIDQVMKAVTSASSAIAAAIEEQGASTEEISRNVQQAAHSSDTVSQNISGVTSAADRTANSVGQIEQASEGVTHQTNGLRQVVDTFLEKVATA